MTDTPEPQQRLEHLPISFFAMVMGLGGFAIATHQLEKVLGGTGGFADAILGVTVIAFFVIAGLYLLKALRHPGAVKAEWAHPIKISFFPAVTISLIILSICFLPLQKDVSRIVWWIGAPLNLAATFAVVTTWINADRYEHVHINPAWFIPAVGNVLAPIAGIEHAHMEINWLFFTVGMVFWIILLTIVFNRLVFHHPIPGRLMPTLFILVAPPAVGFLAYLRLTGDLDAFARILYYAGLLFFILVMLQARKLIKLEFALSWWAYSFPLAAFTAASFRMGEVSKVPVFTSFAMLLYLLLALVITGLVARTVMAIVNKKICLPEG